MKHEQNQKDGTWVSFKMSTDTDEVITQSAKKAIRAKRSEAKLRLDDHCKRFPDWTPS